MPNKKRRIIDNMKPSDSVYCTVRVRGSRHFVDRYYERALDRIPGIDPRRFSAAGYLRKDPTPNYYRLEVLGGPTLVLARKGDEFIGVTILPPRVWRGVGG